MPTISAGQSTPFAVFLMTFAVAAGCEELDRAAGKGPQKPANPTPVMQQFLPPDETGPQPSAPQDPSATENATADSASPSDPAAADPNAPATLQPGEENGPNLQKAEGGVGEKGQGYGGGIITEPVRQYFVGRDRITFEIQIPHSMKLYHAMNNRYPKSFEEFEKEILKPANIELPELPMSKRYVYDPKTGELLVETPAPR